MATRPRPAPRVMTVTNREHITPNMIRVTLAAEWIRDLPTGIEGAHCKLSLPEPGQAEADFVRQLADGPRPTVRTYTIRFIRPNAGEMNIDFVDHGEAGPASAWARRCTPGDICGFGGPGPVKLKTYHADFYLVAADMSALPVAAATLEAMPRDARGIAYLEITDTADRQPIDAPAGVALHWLIHPDPHETPTQAVERIGALVLPEGTIQTCIAGESVMIRALRQEIVGRRGVPKADAYISGYWKIGLVEDEHQKFKQSETAAA